MRISDWSSDVCSSDLGWIGLLDVDAKHVDAGLVAVEHFLRAFADKIGDLGALRTNRRLQRHTGDSGAQRAFGDFPDGVLRLCHLEQTLLGIETLPPHCTSEIANCLVAS